MVEEAGLLVVVVSTSEVVVGKDVVELSVVVLFASVDVGASLTAGLLVVVLTDDGAFVTEVVDDGAVLVVVVVGMIVVVVGFGVVVGSMVIHP